MQKKALVQHLNFFNIKAATESSSGGLQLPDSDTF
jgi:hypothetical protein